MITCPVTDCGLGAFSPHGLCWIHEVRFVICTYKPGRIDSWSIKVALRRRMQHDNITRDDLAEFLGVTRHDINNILSRKRMWLSVATYDKWATLLHLDVTPIHEAAA